MLTTCYDNHCRVWAPPGVEKASGPEWTATDPLSRCLRVAHDNQTGRWVLPFRSMWTGGGDGFVVGQMKRHAEVDLI